METLPRDRFIRLKLGSISNEQFLTTKVCEIIKGNCGGEPSRGFTGEWSAAERYFFEIRYRPGRDVKIDLEVLTCTGARYPLGDDKRSDMRQWLLEYYQEKLAGCKMVKFY